MPRNGVIDIWLDLHMSVSQLLEEAKKSDKFSLESLLGISEKLDSATNDHIGYDTLLDLEVELRSVLYPNSLFGKGVV